MNKHWYGSIAVWLDGKMDRVVPVDGWDWERLDNFMYDLTKHSAFSGMQSFLTYKEDENDYE